MTTEIDHNGTGEIVCPYCGYEHSDSWEAGESGEDECGRCGKKFVFESETTRTFTTRQSPCLNGGRHQWRKITSVVYPKAKKCDSCEFYDWKGDKP